MLLTDDDFCALEYAAAALRAIADRKEQVGDLIQPMNDIRLASSRAKVAIARLEPVLRKLDSMPANAELSREPKRSFGESA